MDEWRSKVLKDVQYVCKLAAWILAWQNGAKTPTPLSAEVTDRLKQGAAALSIARRIMMTGSWIEDYGDLVSACNSEGLRSWKGCTLLAKTASSLIDDVRGPFCVRVRNSPAGAVHARRGLALLIPVLGSGWGSLMRGDAAPRVPFSSNNLF